MRLTLRTLLAYLDDILSPAQAKEIGQKISESNYASQLVDRIRDVMRRRRLTAPELEGEKTSIEATLVAEYLDNTLAPEKVAEIEEVCLKSDIHLAEVAACHQVLTLVLGEPVEIRQKSRERMYALAPWGEDATAAPKDGQKAATPPAVPEPVPAKAASAKAAAGESSVETIPEYLKPAPFLSRARLPILFFTCVGLWFFLLWIDDSYSPWQYLWPEAAPVAPDTDSSQLVADAAPPVAKPRTDAAAVETPPDGGVSEPIATTAAADDAAGKFTPVDPPPPDDEPEGPLQPLVDSTPPVQPELPATDRGEMPPAEGPDPTAVASIERPVAEPEPAEPEPAEPEPPKPTPTDAGSVAEAEPPPPEAAPLEALPLQYNSQSGVLLRYDGDESDWFVMPRRSLIHVGEHIASPKPFKGLIDVDDGLCRITLLGGTSVVSLPPSSTAAFGFDVKRGRLIIEGRSAAAEDGVVLAIVVGSDVWHLQLESADAVCGVEVIPRKPNQFEQGVGEDLYEARLYVLKGTVHVADTKQLRAVASAAGDDSPSTAARLKRPEGENALTVVPIPRKPDWLQPGGKRVSRTISRYASLFERDFAVDEGVSLTVPPLLKSTNPRMSLYAAQCLDLTDNVEELVAALAPAAHDEARQAAIGSLRAWLLKAPENKDILKQALSGILHAADAEVVYRLLWGYNLDDARNPQVSRQLVDWLEHEHITVRELAYAHVSELTGRSYDYRPLAAEGQRNAATRRWRNHVQERGALVR